MNRLKENLWLLVAIVLGIATTVYALSHLATDPSHVIPDLGGDGAKNNFTYLYHSIYGKGYWFDGMNYPFGEHIVYTDGQPLLSVMLASFKGVSISTALGLLWGLISLSYVLSIVYLYKVLREFKTPPLLAIIFAALITIFTPQILRLRSHYALSYTCVIPMLFYWTVKYSQSFRIKYCFYFFILGCVMAFLHPYYVGLILVWTFAFGAGYILLTKEKIALKLRRVTPLLLSVVAVTATVAITMRLTDPLRDRPKTPYIDPYELFTRPRQVVTSSLSPIWVSAKKNNLISQINDGGEGYAYVGLVTLITIFIATCAFLVKTIKRHRGSTQPDDDTINPVWLFIGFSTLLFSMGFPFTLHMSSIKYFFIFKQFRSLGRFSWIFYYIITVYAAAIISQFFTKKIEKRQYILAYSLLTITLFVWGYEASGYIKSSRQLADEAHYNYDSFFSKNEKNWTQFLAENHRSHSDFQAILMLPFFHIGTEKLWLDNPKTGWVMSLGTRAALQLQLPVIDVMMSRSSWSVAEKQVQIAAGPLSAKPMLNELKSSKPFLLMHFEEDSLDIDQKYLLKASDYIGHHAQCHVYACYPDRIRANDLKYTDSMRKLAATAPQGDRWLNAVSSTYIDHFDNGHAKDKLYGSGAAAYQDADSIIVANIPLKIEGEPILFELSCWFLLSDKDHASPYFTYILFDSTGRTIDFQDMLTNKSHDNNGLWFRASRYIPMDNNCHSMRLILRNLPPPSYIAMDELVLRPANTTLVSKSADGKIMINNHIFH